MTQASSGSAANQRKFGEQFRLARERGYIEAGTLTLLNAAGGAGKSMLAIALARAVQRGEALLGQPTRRGNVAYLEPEDVMSTADRLAAVLHALEEAGYLPQTGEEPDA